MRPRLRTAMFVIVTAGLLTIASAWLDCALSTKRGLAVLAQPVAPGPIVQFVPPTEDLGADDRAMIDIRWADYGWPIPSMRQLGPFQPAITSSWLDHGLHISGIRFPLRPLWPGVLTDVLFFSSVISGVMLSAVAFRSHQRRRTGRCSACGYPVASARTRHCSECGHALPTARPA